MAEPGVPHKLKGKLSGYIVQDAFVCLADFQNKCLQQSFKLLVSFFIFGFVKVIPIAVVVFA